MTPSKLKRRRVIRFAIGCLAILGGLFACSAVRQKFAARGCPPETSTALLSPDSQFSATTTLRVCSNDLFGGSYYAVSVAGANTDISNATEVFISEFSPVVTWEGDRHLSIEVTHVVWISKSLHESRGIDIRYSLAKNLTARAFRQSDIDTEARIRADWASRSHGKPDPGTEAAMEIRKQAQAQVLKAFEAWVQSNVPNGHFE